MQRSRRAPIAALLLLAIALVAACNDDALNEFGAEGALQTSVRIELHDGWIGSPEAADGGTAEVPARLRVPPHNDLTFTVINMGAEPHGFAMYADAAGTELLAGSSLIPPGGSEVVTFHFHDDQIAYFFDDQDREQMHGELHVHE